MKILGLLFVLSFSAFAENIKCVNEKNFEMTLILNKYYAAIVTSDGGDIYNLEDSGIYSYYGVTNVRGEGRLREVETLRLDIEHNGLSLEEVADKKTFMMAIVFGTYDIESDYYGKSVLSNFSGTYNCSLI